MAACLAAKAARGEWNHGALGVLRHVGSSETQLSTIQSPSVCVRLEFYLGGILSNDGRVCEGRLRIGGLNEQTRRLLLHFYFHYIPILFITKLITLSS